MRAVGLKVLKNRLSEYVRLAAQGETVLVTDRDRVVAELVPPRSSSVNDALVAEGARQGWLRPALVRSTEIPPSLPAVPFDRMMADLTRDREDRDLP